MNLAGDFYTSNYISTNARLTSIQNIKQKEK